MTVMQILPALFNRLNHQQKEASDLLVQWLRAESALFMPATAGLTPAVFTQLVLPLLHYTSEQRFWEQQVAAACLLLPLSRRKAAVADLTAAGASQEALAALSVCSSNDNNNRTAARCDADSLSVIFSFLEPNEFVAAIATCKSWYGVRLRPRSWPVFLSHTSIEEAAEAVFDSDEQQQLLGARFLRKCVSLENEPQIAEVQAIEGLTDRIVALARQSTNVKLQVSFRRCTRARLQCLCQSGSG